jgi:hypothetical protein
MSCLNLFTNKIVQRHQGCVGRNGLPFAHDALRVNDFASQHGAAVHRELQNVNSLFAAVHFHVRACRNKVSTALGLLRRFVIEQTPKRPNIARSFDVGRINVNRARIVGEHFLPLSMCRLRCKEQKQTGHQCSGKFKAFHLLSLGIHAPYYKVVD